MWHGAVAQVTRERRRGGGSLRATPMFGARHLRAPPCVHAVSEKIFKPLVARIEELGGKVEVRESLTRGIGVCPTEAVAVVLVCVRCTADWLAYLLFAGRPAGFWH